QAEAATRRLIQLFGRENTFIEVQHNLVHGDTRRRTRLAQLSEQLQVPMVATGNVHYHIRKRHRLQDAMVAIKHRSTLESSHRLRRANSEFYLRPPQVVTDLFAAHPEAVQNTRRIAE